MHVVTSELGAGTITISNLGMFGVAHFDAILPPNQGTILAISAALPRVVQVGVGLVSYPSSIM
jgi:pyruvate dehydrogenase E2 component (dihydrolipoamide acetyltransferase)